MTILALDLSLTSTGVAYGSITRRVTTKTTGTARLADIRDEIAAIIAEIQPDVAYIEGYSFGSQGRSVFNIGELGGVIRLLLHDNGIRVVDVPPSSLKKWATGKGNANKDAMLATAIRKHGFQGDSNDEADAWLLLLMATEEES